MHLYAEIRYLSEFLREMNMDIQIAGFFWLNYELVVVLCWNCSRNVSKTFTPMATLFR